MEFMSEKHAGQVIDVDVVQCSVVRVVFSGSVCRQSLSPSSKNPTSIVPWQVIISYEVNNWIY